MLIRLTMGTELWIGKKNTSHAWLIQPIGDVTREEWHREFGPRLKKEVFKAGLVAYRRAYPDLHVLYRDGKFHCARTGPECMSIAASAVKTEALGADRMPPFCPAPGCPYCPHPH